MLSTAYQTIISIYRSCSCIKNDKNNEINKNNTNNTSNELNNNNKKKEITEEPSINEPNCIIDYKETCAFIPPITCGQVIKVYDGDTITIASKLPYPESPLYRFQVRLNGIDCPEIKSKSEDEKTIAQMAKKEMETLTFQKVVYLKNLENEKYGRILADVYIDDIHLNAHMLSQNLAVAYDGGTKRVPKNWYKYYYMNEME
jgi:endonuclease YncB( thermonuclease family)